MATTGRRTLRVKRHREGKTDYRKRLRLLEGGRPRLVIRRTGRQMQVQIVQYRAAGDIIVAGASSLMLKKMGWKGNCCNTQGAYLAGFAAGIKATGKGVKEAVADIGMQRSIGGNLLYAGIKGAIDSGLSVACDERMFPTKERLEGKHVKRAMPLEQFKQHLMSTRGAKK